MTNTSEDDKILAEALIGLGAERLAQVLAELDGGAREALRSLRHPETGELLSLTGMRASHPPRHEPGSGIKP